MIWLKDEEMRAFLARYNFDVRATGNGRWMDQKCAADVITIVADCILQYAEAHPGEYFSSKDIWHDHYTVSNVEAIFKKPSPNEAKARSEYDKFFQQPMEMLTYAHVLEKQKWSGRNYYTVAEPDVLTYLSIRERNALAFLQYYIERVLTDSGMMPCFDDFFNRQTPAAYDVLKDRFTQFTIRYTKINGATECHRIFIKVLNPLAYLRGKHGTEKGRLSKNRITLGMLMYNRDNFRDLYTDKPRELTRRQYAEQRATVGRYNAYLTKKAKRILRKHNDTFRDGRTEVFDRRHNADQAVHIHHIFPEADYPEIGAYYENLIALTPTQHVSYAHPQGYTGRIDTAYQQLCLLAKAETIRETLADAVRAPIYEFGRFLYVLYVGLSDDVFNRIEDGDYDRVVAAINRAYGDRDWR